MVTLNEDFSDVADYVQEDDSYAEQNASEDELDRIIAQKHAKYKEAQAKRQEEVRANRSWSAPPIESPRPEQQKERERERQARSSLTAEGPHPAMPRAEYEPPRRPYLAGQASAGNLSYLSRPQSAEMRSVHRLSSSGHRHTAPGAPASLQGIEEEAADAQSSRQASDAGRWLPSAAATPAGAGSPSMTAADDMPSRDQDLELDQDEPHSSSHAANDEREDGVQDSDGPCSLEKPADHSEGQEEYGLDLAAGAVIAKPPGSQEAEKSGVHREHASGVQEVSGLSGESAADAEADATSGLSAELSHGAVDPYGRSLATDEGFVQHVAMAEPPEDDLNYDESQQGQGDADEGEGGGGSYSPGPGDEYSDRGHGWRIRGHDDEAASTAASYTVASSALVQPPVAAVPDMAMRGFVEPLPFDESYASAGGALELQKQPSAPQVELEASRGGTGSQNSGAGMAEGSRSPAAAGSGQHTPCGNGSDGQGSSATGALAAEEDAYDDSFEDDAPEGEDGQQGAEQNHPGHSSSPDGHVIAATASSQCAMGGGESSDAPAASGHPSTDIDATAGQLLRGESSGLPPAPSHQSTSKHLEAPHLSPTPAQPTSSPPLSAALRSSSTSTSKASALSPLMSVPMGGQDDEDDQSLIRRAAAAALTASTHVSGVVSGAHSIGGYNSSGPELMPPQHFAMQLLKHDIEVLPAHHKAVAESAAARRRPISARPAGTGLGAFGYLGFHVAPDSLTAPSGPAFKGLMGATPRALSPGRQAANPVSSASQSGTTAQPSGSRTSSAPHMRPVPSSGITSLPPAVAASIDVFEEALPTANFIGASRALRAAHPPPSGKLKASAMGGAARLSGGDGSPPTEASLSVLDEQETSAAQNKMTFDVWLDALSGGAHSSRAAADATPSNSSKALATTPAAGAATGRSPRPMTAPASGRRRPVSAHPAAASMLRSQVPRLVTVPKPLGRPISAQPQPQSARPPSARNGADGPASPPGAAAFDTLLAADVPIVTAISPTGTAAAGGGTAAVDVAGVTVSVYVADTVKRIIEANRWLQQLGCGARRYRLKDRLSNMVVQLVEEAPLSLSALSSGGSGRDGNGGCAVGVVKELTLKQFLEGHAKLRLQVRRLRQAAGPPLPLAPPGAGQYGGSEAVADAFGASSSSGKSARAASAAPGSARNRPASAAPYGRAEDQDESAGGVGLSAVYSGTGGTRPYGVRPSSANPAYGRTPTHGALASAFPCSGKVAAGAMPQTRPAWGTSGGAGPPQLGGAGGRNPAGDSAGAPPYMSRSASAAARTGLPPHPSFVNDDDEDEIVVDPDEDGDIGRAVRQQLGSAANYCQARRSEIARLRAMSLT